MTYDVTHGGALDVENISDAIEVHLTAKAHLAVNARKVEDSSGSDYEVRYLGVAGPTADKDLLCKKLAEIINEYVDGLHIVGHLEKGISIELAVSNPAEVPASVYISYLAFTPASARIIDRLLAGGNTNFFKMGETPTEVKE